jgi:hypothetical protein
MSRHCILRLPFRCRGTDWSLVRPHVHGLVDAGRLDDDMGAQPKHERDFEHLPALGHALCLNA